MLQKIKLFLLSLSSLFVLGIPALAPVATSAYTQADINNCVAQGTNFEFNANTGECTNTSLDQGTNVNDLIRKILNILSVLVGIVAVIMIIIGGFRYITSGGSAEKVKGARDTILYALIGLVIVALAQIIVQFVLKNVK